MYEDLISSLRLCRQILHEDDKCIEFVDGCCEAFPVCAYQLMGKAADAIESISKAYQMISEAYEAEVTKQVWIPACPASRPPAKLEQYLVRVRSGGPIYGGWEYDTDLGWWGEYWGPNGSHGYDWHSIRNDWDGEVTITHWMPLPDPPAEEAEEADECTMN